MKARFARFREWQEHPTDFALKVSTPQHCNCCGRTFTGNFCPYCGQKSGTGALTWRSVREGVMDLWGMGSRSLPYTLWQLLWRPGYLMHDYLVGRRQVSFPPVKMLVAIYVLLYVLSLVVSSDMFEAEDLEDTTTATGVAYYLNSFLNWLSAHPQWSVLFALQFLIVPTWLIFRWAPRLPRHTLPQGFFIQVYISTQLLVVLSLINMLMLLLVPGLDEEDAMRWFSMVVVLLLLFIDYKQLFGYGWWGTSWRIIVLFLAFALSIRCFVLAIDLFR